MVFVVFMDTDTENVELLAKYHNSCSDAGLELPCLQLFALFAILHVQFCQGALVV